MSGCSYPIGNRGQRWKHNRLRESVCLLLGHDWQPHIAPPDTEQTHLHFLLCKRCELVHYVSLNLVLIHEEAKVLDGSEFGNSMQDFIRAQGKKPEDMVAIYWGGEGEAMKFITQDYEAIEAG